jgi:macrolide-specific efflux system membrane fusion protein
MRSLNKRKTAVAGGVLGIALVGGGFAVASGGGGGAAAPAQAGSTPAAVVASVTSVSASGTVASAKSRDLSFVTGGTVTKVYVKEGEKVSAGDILARVDPTAAQEQLNAAALSRSAAVKTLNESDSKGHDAAYASYVQSDNAYRKAERAVTGTRIVAPFSGTVTSVVGAVDDEATAGSTFLTLTKLRDLVVTANFTEADTTRLKKGQKASVTFTSLARTVTGKVILIAPTPLAAATTAAGGGGQQSSTQVVQYAVQVSLSSVPAKARVGQGVTVEVAVK